jgi:YidC/Oxa1 family membrane protein insertase
LQKQLIVLNKELDHVADYGILTILARPLFWLLDKAHSIVKNWGLAIIFVTFLLKLLFYPLSEKAGRSMAKMRDLTPRMKALQETYKDDRSKLGQATMDLYRSEKVNPLAGCLPMIIQMPVFLAFYWVLLESVEMRQAPFMLWITDLSSRDPFFILPALNGLAMWIQYKLNPPPPDPVQASLPVHAARLLGDVRGVPCGPGPLLGDQHRSVDPPAMEHQPEARGREERAQ